MSSEPTISLSQAAKRTALPIGYIRGLIRKGHISTIPRRGRQKILTASLDALGLRPTTIPATPSEEESAAGHVAW